MSNSVNSARKSTVVKSRIPKRKASRILPYRIKREEEAMLRSAFKADNKGFDPTSDTELMRWCIHRAVVNS